MAESNQQKLAFEYRVKTQQERQDLLRIERREHEAELKQLVETNNALAESRLQLESRIETAKQLIETLESQLEQQEEMKEHLVQVMTDLKVEVAKLETTLSSDRLTHERLTQECQEAQTPVTWVTRTFSEK